MGFQSSTSTFRYSRSWPHRRSTTLSLECFPSLRLRLQRRTILPRRVIQICPWSDQLHMPNGESGSSTSLCLTRPFTISYFFAKPAVTLMCRSSRTHGTISSQDTRSCTLALLTVLKVFAMSLQRIRVSGFTKFLRMMKTSTRPLRALRMMHDFMNSTFLKVSFFMDG